MQYDDIYAITDIDASISSLRMFSISFEVFRSLRDVFEIFKTESDLPGIILINNGVYVDVLLRVKFFELMSQSFMMEIFNNKPIAYFQSEFPTERKLELPEYTLIVKAVELSLEREKTFRDDPLVVQCADGSIKLLDVYRLLLAHNHIHMLTMQQLKNVNNFKDEMLHIIAHDLKNPINGISGYTLMIEENTELETEPRKWLGNIQKSCGRMLDLIQELLKSANTNNEPALQKTEICISTLIAEAFGSLEKSAQQKQQAILFFNENGSQCLLLADRVKIYEVFENLISNAVKYSPPGTAIEVRIEEVEGSCRVIVADRGPGFSVADRENMFQKFRRLSARPTGGESSTGLGLYIVKTIVEQHKGTITVQDREGGGSTFSVVLPGLLCTKI